MIKKLDLNKLIGYFINRSGRFAVIKAERDWKVMIASFFAVMIIVLALCGYIFWKFQYKYLMEGEESYQGGEGVLSIKKGALNSVLEELEKKDKIYNDTLANPPIIQDPSI